VPDVMRLGKVPPILESHITNPCAPRRRMRPFIREDASGARGSSTVGDLPEAARWFLRRLFWESQTKDQLALELGVSRQAVNKRKHKLLRQLRSELVLKRGSSGVGQSSSEIAFAAIAWPGITS
jgi:hypothetical protein